MKTFGAHLARLFFIIALADIGISFGGPTEITDPPDTPLSKAGFVLTFFDDFTNNQVDVADGSGDSWKGGRKWYGHLPFPATVGEALFVTSHATTKTGSLCLQAKKDASGKWTSAMLSSQFPTGSGFSQQYGYFEARLRLPTGQGAWPQFWLFGQGLNYDKGTNQRAVTAEIDILEVYGIDRSIIHQNYHEHTPKPDGSWSDIVPPETVFRLTNADQFHIFGALVKPDTITWYIDGKAIRQMATPEAAKQPLSVIIGYALGGGYPVTGVADPSTLFVDYVRVYQVPLP